MLDLRMAGIDRFEGSVQSNGRGGLSFGGRTIYLEIGINGWGGRPQGLSPRGTAGILIVG